MLEISAELHTFAGLQAGYSLDEAVGCISLLGTVKHNK